MRPQGTPPNAPPRTIEIGRGEYLRRGERVALLGYGSGVAIASAVADRLRDEHAIHATVVDARFAKPLDAALIAGLVAGHELLVTVEENVLAGGFGSAVGELLLDCDLGGACRMLRAGLPDRYMGHGDPGLLRGEAGLAAPDIVRRIVQALGATASVGA